MDYNYWCLHFLLLASTTFVMLSPSPSILLSMTQGTSNPDWLAAKEQSIPVDMRVIVSPTCQIAVLCVHRSKPARYTPLCHLPKIVPEVCINVGLLS